MKYFSLYAGKPPPLLKWKKSGKHAGNIPDRKGFAKESSYEK